MGLTDKIDVLWINKEKIMEHPYYVGKNLKKALEELAK